MKKIPWKVYGVYVESVMKFFVGRKGDYRQAYGNKLFVDSKEAEQLRNELNRKEANDGNKGY